MTRPHSSLRAVLFLLCAAVTVAALADTGDAHSISIAVTTDDFQLASTDITHLTVGEAETIVTDSGRTVDLLRTENGVEIYVDGELLDTGLHSEPGLHTGHDALHQRIEVACLSPDSCEKYVWLADDDPIDLESVLGGNHEIITLHQAHAHEDMDSEAGDHHEKIIVIEKRPEVN